MPWTAAAIAGAAVVGAAASSNASKRAAASGADTANAQMGATDAAIQRARGDLFKLFPSAEDNAQKGYQGALDVFGQFMPQQADTFQQGNVAAQNQILAGMPQAHNALMGGAIDYSQFQPTQIDYDPSVFQQQLPDYQSTGDALGFDAPGGMNFIGPQQNPTNALMGPTQLSQVPSLGKGWVDYNKKALDADIAARFTKKVATKDPVVKGLKKLFSDERLKEDIKKVGEIAGQDLYTWTWRDTNATRSFAGDAGIGFIAQEVEKSNPNAVTIDSKSGYKKITLAEIFKGEK